MARRVGSLREGFVGVGPELALERCEHLSDTCERVGFRLGSIAEASEALPLRRVAQHGGDDRWEERHEHADARTPETCPRAGWRVVA